MKRLAFVALAGVVSLASTPTAQGPFVPSISEIPAEKAFDPGNVTVFGSLLGLVTEARVNGVVYPIVRNTGSRLVVGPVAPQPPGFGSVELFYGGGTASGTLELTPSLVAVRRGTRAITTIDNGDVGTFVLAGSFRRLPVLAADDGIYYGRLIPLNSSVLATGAFTDETTVTIRPMIPIEIGLIGAPFNLQARCSVGAEGFLSYTNMVTVSAIGHQ
jgi:hypothetical protein